MTPEDMAGIHAEAMTIPGPWGVRDFKELMTNRGVFLVSHGLCGFALGRVVLDEAELLTLAVSPTAQGQGIGRSCLEQFEAEAANLGAKHLHLEVAKTNVPALALYERAGWLTAGRRKAYYKASTGRTDAILMTKEVNID